MALNGTMFDVTVKLVTLAVVETLRKTTFPVWIFAVRRLEEIRLAWPAVRYVTLAPVDTFRFRMFENTVLRVWTFAVRRFEETRLAWPAVRYVTFAPVDTFRFRMFEKTAFKV